MTTVTIVGSTSDDNTGREDTTYGEAHDTVLAETQGPTSAGIVVRQQDQRVFTPRSWAVSRGFLIFDTSSIVGIITSAILKLYPYGINENTTASIRLVVQSGQPVYPHIPVVLADFDKTLYSGDYGSIAYSEWVLEIYNDITLDTSVITQGGITKLCLRTSDDISGTPPIPPALWWYKNDGFNLYSANAISSKRPKLVITYGPGIVTTLPAGWTATLLTKTPPTYIDRTWALIRGELLSLGGAIYPIGVYLGFDYGKTTNYGHVQWYNPPLGATKVFLPRLFSANIGSLQPGTTYHYCAKAQLKGNVYVALLNGSVTLVEEYEGVETDCYFEWGEDTDYGYETVPTVLHYSGNFSSVVLLANEDDPEGTFHFRAVARNAFDTLYGEDIEFTALGAFYGEDESFETLTGLPPPVFGAGEGYDYITTKQALEHVAKVAVGRGYGDSEGNFNYESRNVR
ncbi:MAG: hypothetical protein MUO99_06080 [Dehalococcoidales bacterium]|nr:hypothetical protein [Dehalococcoidales bacterium]